MTSHAQRLIAPAALLLSLALPPRASMAADSVNDGQIAEAAADSILAVGEEDRADSSPAGPVVLPEYLVTATRIQESPKRQPYAFYRRGARELRETVGRTLTDRIQFAPGVVIQRTGPGQASPFVRGLTGEQTLLLLDGVRYNHAAMRPGPNQYSAMIADESVSSIDIVLGSVSAVTGSDGLTGALDFRIAKPGRGATGPASVWAQTRLSTSDGQAWSAGFDGDSGDWAYSVEGSFASYGELSGGELAEKRVFGADGSEIPNTAYDQHAFAARLSYVGLDGHRFELMAGQSQQDEAPRPDGYFENTGDPSRIARYFDPQRFRYVHLRHRTTPAARWLDRVQTTLWYHQHHEEEFRTNFIDPGTTDVRYRRRELEDSIEVLGADFQGTTVVAHTHALTWGGTLARESTSNAYREFRSPTGVSDPAAVVGHDPGSWAGKTTIPDGSEYRSIGVFAQDQWKLQDDWRLLGGIRYSRNSWDAPLGAERGYSVERADGSADAVTGNVRLSHDLRSDMMLFAGWSQGFRAPNLTNLTGLVDRGSSGVFFEGNPELDSETSRSMELGWRKSSMGRGLGISVFRTTVDNLIQQVYVTLEGERLGRVQNAEGAVLYGLEIDSDWMLLGEAYTGEGELSAVGSVSYVRGRVDVPQEDGTVVEENISRANRFVGRAGMRYRSGRGWWLMPQARLSADYDDASPRDAGDIRMTIAGNDLGQMPGFIVVDLLAGYNWSATGQYIQLAAENLLDKTYRDVGSGVDGAGFGVILSAGTRF